MNQTLNITRALAEIKKLDDKISRAARDGVFVAVTVGKNSSQKLHEVALTVDAAKAKIQSSFDTITAMFEQRAKIKAAVVLSNATTKVSVLGREVSVAEAIEMKTSVNNKKMLLLALKQQYNKCTAAVTNLNTKLDETIELNLKTIYGADNSKADPAAYEAIAKPQREQKEAAMLDPKDIVKKITELEEEISVIDTELDYTLSTQNAMTVITIS